jgi:hypothetical protein
VLDFFKLNEDNNSSNEAVAGDMKTMEDDT